MDAYNFPSPYANPQLIIRNIGTSTATISAVYYDGALCAAGARGCAGADLSGSVLPVQGTALLTLKVAPADRGTTHHVKVVMADGASFSSTLVAGLSG